MHRKRGVPNSPRIVADAKETACTRVISSPYRITESAEILSRLNPLPNPALLGFQSVEIQASNVDGAASAKQLDVYQRTTGALRRTLESLGLRRRPRYVTPPTTLNAYLNHIENMEE